MAVERMRFVLLVYRADGRPFSEAELAGLRPEQGAVVSFGPHQNTLSLQLCRVDEVEFPDGPQGVREYQHARSEVFVRCATWLEQRTPAVFSSLREAGYSLELWLFMDISQDQAEFTAPSRFLLACGERDLSLDMITNE